ncbi:hypothetical protein CCMA1212_003948 [Trichoderma ghanense]|uniref:RING-type domain-containing protein n=1 Tax=Trichoderma ghanense TaxID=65468 RepID=A0ABY2H9L7_9HYPO
MGLRNLKAAVTETIKETIKAACRPSWALMGKKRDRESRGFGSSSSITVTHTITQTTSQATTPDLPPLISCNHPFARRDRSWSPSLLTIDSEIEFSPEGTPPGVALGIPPEHILDEGPSPIGDPIPLNFHRLPAPATPRRAGDDMLNSLSPFDGASSIASVDNPFVGVCEIDDMSNDGPQGTSWATPEASSEGRTAVRNERRGTVDDATLPLQEYQLSLIHDMLSFSLPNRASERLAAASLFASARHPSFPCLSRGNTATDLDSGSCSLCGTSDTYQEPYPDRDDIFQERRAYLPCGHFFGHRCLYSWMYSAFCNRRPLRCPRGCVSLLHKCGHPTLPVWQRPARLHSDPETAIPWDYDFCESEQGERCIQMISGLTKAERATAPRSTQPEGEEEGKRSLRRRLRDTLVSPVFERMQRAVERRRQEAMRYWKSRQISWWLDSWADTWGIDPQSMTFW